MKYESSIGSRSRISPMLGKSGNRQGVTTAIPTYSQSPGNTIWIGFQEIYQDEYKKYWEDGSYVAITTVTGDINAIPYAAPAGAKVFYNNGNHSAIKAGTHTFVSKWGNMGLYEHIPDDCPYISDSVTYYKRNK